MKIIDASRSGLTVIGRQGENRRTAVRFPVSAEVFEEYPEATVQVLHQRFGDPAAYPVHEDEYRVDSDGVVVWTVLSGDTAKCGRGQCELVFSEGDVVVLTIIYATQVLPSLSVGEEPPEPWESWTGEISRSRDAAAASAEEAAGSAAEAAESARQASVSAAEAVDTVEAAREQAEEAGQQAAAAAQSAEDAEAARDAAQDAEEATVAAKEAAERNAAAAGRSATQAAEYATGAAQEADAAGDEADRAESAKAGAEVAVTAAARQAEAAAGSASEASRLEASAGVYAGNAARSATAAAGSAGEARTEAGNAAASASGAAESALVAEGWAKGTQGGTPVGSESAYYENNARYYAGLTQADAQAAKEAKDQITGMSATAQTLTAGSAATASYADGVLTIGVPKGADGTNGTDGDDGVTFTPAVSAAGVLSWSNDGGRTNPQSVDVAAAVRGSIDVTVSGTTPTITGAANHYYKCGTVSTIGITAPASGHFIVVFTSGTTAAVLTATGISWPEWFNPNTLESGYTYEISVMDGRGAVMAWPT